MRFLSCFFIWIILAGKAFAQYDTEEPDSESQHIVSEDTIQTSGVRSAEKFNIVFNRGFIVTQSSNDSVPVKGSASGTTFIGLSFNKLLSPRFAIQFQPGFSGYKFEFPAKPEKIFPTRGDTVYRYERLRFFYIDIPIGLRYNLVRDSRYRAVSFIEFGGSIGYHIASSTKRSRMIGDQEIKEKLSGAGEVNKLRVCLYIKAHYRFLGIWINSRITNVYDPNKTYFTDDGRVEKYPRLPSIEIGLSVTL